MKSSDRKLPEWLEPERLCKGLPRRKKRSGLDWCLITLLFFNFTFFVYCWGAFISFVKLELGSTWAWELSAFEDGGQSTKIPLQTPQPKAHCPSSFSSSSCFSQEKVLAGSEVSPPGDGTPAQGHPRAETKEPNPPLTVPHRHCPFTREDSDPSLAQAVPGHAWRCARLWQWEGIEPWTSQLWAGHAAPDSCPGVALTRL